MSMIRVRRYTLSFIVLGSLASASVEAATFRNAALGLSLLDFQFSGQRNLLGDGFTVNADAFYNNRRFNFGVADLTLNGQMDLSAGITKRGIPSFEFNANTGGSSLLYTFNINNGIQDLTASGSVFVNIGTKINALGFYDQTFQISNRGTYATDGFALVDSGTLDFDAGPIDIHGNIFADGLAALTQPLFNATGTENPFAKFSGKATKSIEANKKVEELRARIDSGEVLSDDDMAVLINNSIIAAMLGGKPDSHLFDQLLAPEELLKDASAAQTKLINLETVPEPLGVCLLAATLPLLSTRRRRAA